MGQRDCPGARVPYTNTRVVTAAPAREAGELFSGEVGAVDEHQFAGVKADRPPPSGADKLLFPDPNGMTAHFTEIIDDDPAPFGVRPGVHPHPSTDLNPICGAVLVARALGHT
jgi:hypothetical protein